MLLLSIMATGIYAVTNAKLNKEQNVLEFVSDLEVINQKSKIDNAQCCKVFTPLAPYNNVTCVISAPKQVHVGVPFVVDFALTVRSATYISFWADLIPSQEQMIAQGLQLIDYKPSPMGIFEEYAESIANQGGRGTWRFEQGIPAGMYHISFTYVAHDPGLKSFTTILATNPPSYIKMREIVAVDEAY